MSAIRRLATSVVLGLLLAAPPLAAELAAGELRPIGGPRSKSPARTAAARKIVSRLRAVAEGMRAEGLTTANALERDVAQRFSSPAVRVDDAARVHVDVTVTDASETGLAVLRAHGLDVEIVNEQFGVVEGWIPAENLEALAAEPVVVIVRPPSYATRRIGSVNSQGTAIHRCDVAQATGTTGAGIRVGVISDGVDGLAASQGSGNLPAVQVLSGGSGDEGTAML
jgi:hypothetical protein